jgi:hypothetical protein
MAFGSASLAGVFGHVVDAFVAICHAWGFSPCTKWIDNFVFFWHPLMPSSFAYTLTAVLALGDKLGWLWKVPKTHLFADHFTYLGFRWLLCNRTVSILAEKKAKYLAHLSSWAARTWVF